MMIAEPALSTDMQALQTLQPGPHVLDTTCPQDIRRAIDLVATIRARVIRVGLFGTLLYRPDPRGPTSDEGRARQLEILRRQIKVISRVVGALQHASALPDTAQEITNWIHQIAQADPKTLKEICALDQLSRDVLAAAESCSTTQPDCLARHMEIARSGFFQAVTRLCDALWEDVATHQAHTLERAQAAAAALATRLARLDRIGTHVRLVSLNASVEASRVGEMGRGLSLIAQEFKGLAEEVQTIAKEARSDVSKIVEH